MGATNLDIIIEKGSDYERVFQINDSFGDPLDLTDYEAFSQIRQKYTSPDVAVEVSVTFSETPEDGKLFFRVPAATSSAVTIAAGVYDIEIVSPTPNSKTTRIVQGKAIFSPECTREVSP